MQLVILAFRHSACADISPCALQEMEHLSRSNPPTGYRPVLSYRGSAGHLLRVLDVVPFS